MSERPDNRLDDAQELRRQCLLIALQAGVCGECAVYVAADFEAFIRDGELPADEDDDAFPWRSDAALARWKRGIAH